MLAAALVFSCQLLAQGTREPAPVSSAAIPANAWSLSATVDGYVAPNGDSYVSPIFTADHDWVHLEGRYNYEDQGTGSLWFGYNFKCGEKLNVVVTPMVGGVFGDTTGVAPGYEVSATYKKIWVYSAGEYVFDVKNRQGSFFFNWPEGTYSPRNWFHAGLAAQQTKVYRKDLTADRGFLVSVSHKQLWFTTYVFNVASASRILLFEISARF